MAERPCPQVRVTGKDPADWEADFPDMRIHGTGAKFKAEVAQTEPQKAIVWKLEEDGPDHEEEEDTFYSITGNFNDWQDDRMAAGEAPGNFTSILEVPQGGLLQFRILKEGDAKQVIAPA